MEVAFDVVAALLVCFTDLVLRFIREVLLIDFAGVEGIVSGMVGVLFMEALRRKLTTVSGLIDCSEIPVFKGSSWTGETKTLSTLFRVNIERSPPFESRLLSLLAFKGTRCSSSGVGRFIGGGRARRVEENVAWRL